MGTINMSMSELNKAIRESANEFKAILGKNVDNLNKKNNEKAYKDIEKELKSYDGGLRNTNDRKKKEIIASNDENKGMQDLTYDNQLTKDFKDRVKAQIKGYTSVEDEKRHEKEGYGNAEAGGSLDNIDKKQDKDAQNKKTGKKMGLTGRETKDIFDNPSLGGRVFENTSNNNDKMKQLWFKKTEFTNEEHITSKIPDEFKSENNRFIVKDKTNTEYLVEWSCNKANVISKYNKDVLNEELNRMRQLFNYKSSDRYKTNHSMFVDEDAKFKDNLDKFNKFSNQ